MASIVESVTPNSFASCSAPGANMVAARFLEQWISGMLQVMSLGGCCDTYALRVKRLTIMMCRFLLQDDQLSGFSGSLGPSQPVDSSFADSLSMLFVTGWMLFFLHRLWLMDSLDETCTGNQKDPIMT